MAAALKCIIGGNLENQCILVNNKVPLMEQKNYCLTTQKYAANKGIKAESVRARYYLTKSYFGDIPIRGLNGRLLWPDNSSTK